MHQYKVFILLIQVFLITQFSLGSFERTAQPTSLFGRAFSGSALFSINNLWLNPASIARNSSFEASLFYSPSPFQLPQLSNYGLQVIKNVNEINISAGYSSFGFSLYRETVFSFSAATMVTESFAAGIALHGNHLSIQSYGSATAPMFDLGIIFSATDEINIAFSFSNFTRSSFGADDDIPQIFITGLSYSLVKDAVVTIDLVHDVRYSTTYRTGIEFSPMEFVTLRAGTQKEHSRLFGGIGIKIFSLSFDYGIATHTELGLTHSIGITFSN
jgi:hypothetical protein